jgi:quinol monooxygenase YgiN
MDQVVMIIRTRTQPGKRDEVYRLFEAQLAPRAQANEAQELVVWCADENDPDTFYLIEIYRDRAAQAANSQAPWFFEYLGAVQPLLAGMPEVMSATPRWVKVGTAGASMA